jgi:hypothetical protein
MGSKNIALVSVILMMAISFAPMLADDSAADNTARMSDSYVLTATTTFREGTVFRDDCAYFKASNTEGIAAMNALLDDHKGAKPEDDSTTLRNGDTVKIYYATTTLNIFSGFSIPIQVKTQTGTDSYSVTADLDTLRSPYSPGFFVKAGDDFSVRIIKAVDDCGKDVQCYYKDENGGYHDLSETYEGTMKKTKEFTFDTVPPIGFDGRFYIDLTYESTGFSTPSGSAALFAGLCAAVTIAIFCILAYAGLKPRWSK